MVKKEKEATKGDTKCPNCNDTGEFIDDNEVKTCPCVGIK